MENRVNLSTVLMSAGELHLVRTYHDKSRNEAVVFHESHWPPTTSYLTDYQPLTS